MSRKLIALFKKNPNTHCKHTPLTSLLSSSSSYSSSSSSVKLQYDDYNDNSDPNVSPLLISHGMLGSRHNWTSIAKQLNKTSGNHSFVSIFNKYFGVITCEGRRILTVDARNHGDSPHVDEMTYELMASDLAQLVRDLDLGRVSLAGHSMGGRTVMMAALTNMVEVDKLIVLDISPINQKFDVTSSNEWNMEHFFHCLKV